MTRKQIESARRSLPIISIVPKSSWTEEQKRLDEELDCMEMIISCLAYGGIADFWRECEWRFGEKSYAEPYIKSLGLQRVKEIVAEQEKDFSKAVVSRGIFTDSDGCTYNTVRWADEL